MMENFFELFGLPVAFDIDSGRLTEQYRELQKQVHPDRFVNEDEQLRLKSVQDTALLNEAFQTLKDPAARASYMLKLAGIDIDAEKDTSMDAAFLMEQMEFREAVAQVDSMPDPLGTVDEMAATLKKKLDALYQTFDQQYAANDLAGARDSVRKLQFLMKARQELEQTAERLEDDTLH